MTPRTTDEWYTPPWLFSAAGVTFDLDVCAPVDPILRTCPARAYFTAEDDGLTQPWHGLVWMNPPYSKAEPWVRRWADHADGLALVPALPEVKWRAICHAGRGRSGVAGAGVLHPTGRDPRPYAVHDGSHSGGESVPTLCPVSPQQTSTRQVPTM